MPAKIQRYFQSWVLRQAVKRGALEWDCTECCAAAERAGVTFRPPMVCFPGRLARLAPTAR